jgi:hypothetical protein
MDLARFLFPYSFIPRRWRSSLFEHNAGLPTRSVCSSMIAAAFSSVKFPVLPLLEEKRDGSLRMIPRNTRLFTPRDFDYSPYFDIIKCPHQDFSKQSSYRELPWDNKGRVCNDDGDCFVPTMQPEPEPGTSRQVDLIDDLGEQNSPDSEDNTEAATVGKTS